MDCRVWTAPRMWMPFCFHCTGFQVLCICVFIRIRWVLSCWYYGWEISSTSSFEFCPESRCKWLKFFSNLACSVWLCVMCLFFFPVLPVGTVSFVWLYFRQSWPSSIASFVFLRLSGPIVGNSQLEAPLLFGTLFVLVCSAWKENDRNQLHSCRIDQLKSRTLHCLTLHSDRKYFWPL